jgi:hypothetical protein
MKMINLKAIVTILLILATMNGCVFTGIAKNSCGTYACRHAADTRDFDAPNGQAITTYGNGQYGYSQSYRTIHLETILPSQKPHYTHNESHFFYDGEWY